MMRLFQTFLAITAAGVLAAQAAQDWHSLGLSDRAVHCILADDTSTIIAGTDSGVSVYWNAKWYHIAMLPVTAIVRISPMIVAVAAGNGSKSDGVYIGKNIINGPPFYSFTLGDYCMLPTALAAGPAVSEHAANLPYVLYVGNKNSVSWGLVRNDSLSKLSVIPMPQYAFGVEMPYCAALHIFNNRLYAGGYDRSPMAGPSSLLYYFGDSLCTMRKMKTTAMTEGRLTKYYGSNSLALAIADLDSGVFYYNPFLNEPWQRIGGPPSTPIVSLCTGKTSNQESDTILYAANKDGVFQCARAGLQPIWVKLGTLAVESLYITSAGTTGELLAATVKGVCRYGEQGSGVSRASGSTAKTNANGKRTMSVSVNLSPHMGKTRFNLQGRSIVSNACAGAKASGAVVTDVR